VTKFDQVRACLREGPTTSGEVAATTGLSVKNACARLRDLEARGQAKRIGLVRGSQGRSAVLYMETKR